MLKKRNGIRPRKFTGSINIQLKIDFGFRCFSGKTRASVHWIKTFNLKTLCQGKLNHKHTKLFNADREQRIKLVNI